MMCDCADEILNLKEKVLNLEKTLQQLQVSNFKDIPLAFVAQELNISRQALTFYVKSNFEPEVDFYLKNNRILLTMNILPSIKRHYNAKKK